MIHRPTPGPLVVDGPIRFGRELAYVVENRQMRVTTALCTYGLGDDEACGVAHADALLYAAAPDGLEAARYVLGIVEGDCGGDLHEDNAGKRWHPEKCPACRLRAFIAKAGGC